MPRNGPGGYPEITGVSVTGQVLDRFPMICGGHRLAEDKIHAGRHRRGQSGHRQLLDRGIDSQSHPPPELTNLHSPGSQNKPIALLNPCTNGFPPTGPISPLAKKPATATGPSSS